MTLQKDMDEDRKRERAEMDAPDTEQLASSSAERDVGARKVVHGGLGEHGIVLKLGLAERGAVAGNEDQLGYKAREAHGEDGGRINGVSPRDLLSLTLQSPEREIGKGTNLCRCASA